MRSGATPPWSIDGWSSTLAAAATACCSSPTTARSIPGSSRRRVRLARPRGTCWGYPPRRPCSSPSATRTNTARCPGWTFLTPRRPSSVPVPRRTWSPSDLVKTLDGDRFGNPPGGAFWRWDLSTTLASFHEAADIYLEGFPVGSPTALLEVGLLSIPCVRAPRTVPPPFAADGIALSGVRQPVDVADYVRAAIALVQHEGERRLQGSALARAIQAHHTQARWSDNVHNAESALPERHRVYSLAGAAPLSTHLRDFSVALSTLGHSENTLSFTFRAAFNLGLRVRVDASLAAALITQCLFNDPRLTAQGAPGRSPSSPSQAIG